MEVRGPKRPWTLYLEYRPFLGLVVGKKQD